MTRDEAIKDLKKWLPEGSKVYTLRVHRSASGMTRWATVYAMVDNEPINITRYAAQVTYRKLCRRHYAIKSGGCGYCDGHSIVYDLASELYGNGYALTHCWLGQS